MMQRHCISIAIKCHVTVSNNLEQRNQETAARNAISEVASPTSAMSQKDIADLWFDIDIRPPRFLETLEVCCDSYVLMPN